MTTEPGSATALLLALLFAGHATGDFVLQTRSMALGKQRPGPLFRHGALVLGAHLVALAPFLSLRIGLVALAIGLSHVLIDAGKARLDATLAGRPRAPLGLFLLDQALHAAILVGAWAWLVRSPLPDPRWVSDMRGATWIAWCVAAYAFNAHGAGSVIGLWLAPLGGTTRPEVDEAPPTAVPDAPPTAAPGSVGGGAREPERARVTDPSPGRGRQIGILERMLVLTLLLVGQWGVIGFVLAAKSIARFEELKRQAFAEYYLIGTLLSVLFAIGTGLALSAIVP